MTKPLDQILSAIREQNEAANNEPHVNTLIAALTCAIEQRDNASSCFYETLYGKSPKASNEFAKDKVTENFILAKILLAESGE
jgi:hypothetical protein